MNNIFKVIGTIIFVVTTILMGYVIRTFDPTSQFFKEKNKQYPVVVLEENNTIAFRNIVNPDSVASAQKKAMDLSKGLSKNQSIYLFLDTPGGMVTAGQELITTLKSLPQNIKTITNFAASMGFVMVQSLGERLILPTGTLMMHRATLGVEGQVPGEFDSRYRYWTSKIQKIENEMAARLNVTEEDYAKLVQNEAWKDGIDSVMHNFADEIVFVRCAENLQDTYEEEINTLFGTVTLTWSECPLIASPLSIDMRQLPTEGLRYNEVKIIKELIFTYAYDRIKFVKDPTLVETYTKYIK
jgi:ATP-dependent Clp protease protease subunit